MTQGGREEDCKRGTGEEENRKTQWQKEKADLQVIGKSAVVWILYPVVGQTECKEERGQSTYSSH